MIRRRPIRKSAYRWSPSPKPANVLRWEIILDGAAVRMPDGREICQPSTAGRRLYADRVQQMVQRQDFRCSLCNERLSPATATFEHERRRGAGGSRRDDRIVDECGNWLNSAAHWICNSEKG
jgi:hypothetical protein